MSILKSVLESNLFAVPLVVLGCITLVLLLYKSSFKKDQDDITSNLERLFLAIREDIKFAVAPKFIEFSTGVNELVDLAIEIWRIEQRILKASPDLQENQRKGLESSIQKLKRYLNRYDIEIVDHTNRRYNDGLNLDVLSVEKDGSIAESIVKETIEPTIMCKGQVVRKAKIILLSK